MLINSMNQIYILFELINFKIDFIYEEIIGKDLCINVLVWIINCIFSCYLFLNKIFAEILIFLMERTEIIPSNFRVNNNHESKYNYVIDYFNNKTPKKSDKSWFERFIRIPLESFLIKLGFLDEKNSFSYIAKKRSEENFHSLWRQNSDIYVESKVNFAENFEVSVANRLGIASVEELEAVPVEELEAVPVEELEAVPVEELEAVPVEELEAVPVEELEAVPVEVINTLSPRFNSEYRAMTSYMSNLNAFGSFVPFGRFDMIFTWVTLEESILDSHQQIAIFVSEQKEEISQLKQLKENFAKTEDSKLHPEVLEKIDLYLKWGEKWSRDCQDAFDSFLKVFFETRNSQSSDNEKLNRVRSHLFFFLNTTNTVLEKKKEILEIFREMFDESGSFSD